MPPPEPAGRRRGDLLTTWLARLATRQPRHAIILAGQLGRLRHRLTRRWPSASEVGALFPAAPPARVARIANAIAQLEERNEVLVRTIRRSGVESLRALVDPAGIGRLPDGPCILITFHVGALHAVGIALEALGRPVLAFRQGLLFTPRAPVEVLSIGDDDQQRSAAFIRALAHLRRGGVVLVAADAAAGATLDADCLGHPLALARGAFALGTMTGAPIVPLVMRWRKTSAEVVVGGPLAGDSEASLAHAAAHCLETYLREHPGELGLGLLRELLYGLNR
jgi:lauroyl/myristoyl acyltransferase